MGPVIRMTTYDDQFYENRHQGTIYSAETILGIVQRLIPEIKSAVDLGCGVGTWLSVLEQSGATDVCGVDGSWVNKKFLKIRKEHFIEKNLAEDIDLDIGRRFDLAMSLEVAEHLPPDAAEDFVSLLTGLSDFVLFSAAIPDQGGIGHVNEQWPTYWISLFERRGYVAIDAIRKQVWADKSIKWWYRQNALLFVKDGRVGDLTIDGSPIDHIPAEVYLLSFQAAVAPKGIKRSCRELSSAIARRLTGTLT